MKNKFMEILILGLTLVVYSATVFTATIFIILAVPMALADRYEIIAFAIPLMSVTGIAIVYSEALDTLRDYGHHLGLKN